MFRLRQLAIHPDVALDKAVEIRIRSSLRDLLHRQRRIDLAQGFRLNRPLQMNVQFGEWTHSCHNNGRECCRYGSDRCRPPSRCVCDSRAARPRDPRLAPASDRSIGDPGPNVDPDGARASSGIFRRDSARARARLPPAPHPLFRRLAGDRRSLPLPAAARSLRALSSRRRHQSRKLSHARRRISLPARTSRECASPSGRPTPKWSA